MRPEQDGEHSEKCDQSNLTPDRNRMNSHSDFPGTFLQQALWMTDQVYFVAALEQPTQQGKELILPPSPDPLCIQEQKRDHLSRIKVLRDWVLSGE